MYQLWFLFGILSIAHGSQQEQFETFLRDIIDTWKLQSPTIIVQDYFPKICMELQWVLCLSESMGEGTNELENHLTTIHQQRKQDGVLFIGSKIHKELVKELTENTPSIFSSNCPVFMPTEYTEDISLRLDSNIIFYQESSGMYELIDKFAVKGGLPIIDVLGYWEIMRGIVFVKSMHRWERRTNLEGASLINCLTENTWYANFLRDKGGNITGSEGYFPDILFLISDRLNLTVETTEHSWEMQLLENGSWTGGIGVLQRKVADVCTLGLGINFQRSHYIDYPIATDRQATTLHAAIP